MDFIIDLSDWAPVFPARTSAFLAFLFIVFFLDRT